MTKKGYGQIRPVGVTSVEDDACWYYYYVVPQGIVELEVSLDSTQRYFRQVTAFVTDLQRVKELLEE